MEIYDFDDIELDDTALDDIIDDSQWWEKYQELELSWELAYGIYDPPLI